jgi:hypothetical protein
MTKTKPEAVKKDDLMALIYYVKVKSKDGSGELCVYDVDNKSDFYVRGESLIEQMLSACQFEETAKVTKTELAEKLVNAVNTPFTVVFEKNDGSERTLRGRLLSPEPLLGRSYVEDLDIASGNRTRLVDHRTLKSLVVNGVKYVVKK